MKKVLFLVAILAISISFAQDASQLKSKVRYSIDELREFVAIPNDALEHADINLNLSVVDQKIQRTRFQFFSASYGWGVAIFCGPSHARR